MKNSELLEKSGVADLLDEIIPDPEMNAEFREWLPEYEYLPGINSDPRMAIGELIVMFAGHKKAQVEFEIDGCRFFNSPCGCGK